LQRWRRELEFAVPPRNDCALFGLPDRGRQQQYGGLRGRGGRCDSLFGRRHHVEAADEQYDGFALPHGRAGGEGLVRRRAGGDRPPLERYGLEPAHAQHDRLDPLRYGRGRRPERADRHLARRYRWDDRPLIRRCQLERAEKRGRGPVRREWERADGSIRGRLERYDPPLERRLVERDGKRLDGEPEGGR